MFESAINTLLLSICTLPRKASQYLCYPGLNFRVFMELSRVLGVHKCAALVLVLFGKKNSHRIQGDSFSHNINLHKKPSVYKRLSDCIHVLLAKMGIFFLSNEAWNFSKWYFLLMKKIKDYELLTNLQLFGKHCVLSSDVINAFLIKILLNCYKIMKCYCMNIDSLNNHD